jgi:C-terminal processing protease CtpA/Prc
MVLLLSSALFLSGCHKNNFVKVTGKVMVDGVPVQTGSIAFAPADGQTSVEGAEIKDGVYEAKVPPGEKIVRIRGMKLETSEVYDAVSKTKYPSETAIRITPEKYETEKSPLKATITKNGEIHDFDIPSKEKRK